MVLFGTRGPWLCRVIRGGIEWPERLSLWRLTFRLILTLEPKCPRTGLATAGEISQGGNGRVRDHSSCLWLQILGVERGSFLPNGQRDRGNLPRQSETRHLRPDPFGEQSLVELPERTLPDGGLDRRALEQIFEMVIVTGIELAHRYRPLRSFQPPLDIPVPSSCCSGAAIVVGQ